jgi:hypothetical protein
MTRSSLLAVARAEALFVSDVSAITPLTRPQAEAAIRGAVRRHHGTRGCVAVLADAYGSHPELAATRMRWARRTVEALFSLT